MTDNEKTTAWVLFDGDCRLCTATACRFERALAQRSFKLLPLQTPWVRERLGLPQEHLLAEMRVLFADGKFLGGADAVVYLSRRIWWLWPLWAVSRVPGAMPLLHRGYRWFAANRYCISGKCEVRARKRHHKTRTFFEMP